MSLSPRIASRRVSLSMLAVACLLAAVAACADDLPPASTPSGQPTASAAVPSASGSVAVPATLAFSAPMVGGGQFDGASLAGKPAVLWFWASWCPRCQAKASDVQMLQAEYVGRVTFVGVAGLGSGDDAMARFVTQHSLGGFTHLADDEGTVWRHFGVAEQEVFVVLDKTGTVVHTGPLTAGGLRERLAELTG
jgi:thiol-disulfide isomerase/thioredoxin